MTVAAIDLQLDEDAVQLFNTASAEDQQKLRVLLSFWLREFILSPTPLTTLMDEISDKAQSRGLTPEILESLLNEN